MKLEKLLYPVFKFIMQTNFKFRRLRWASHVARMEEGRSSVKMLTGTPAGKKPLGTHRRRRRLEDSIRMHLKDTGTNTRNWVGSA